MSEWEERAESVAKNRVNRHNLEEIRKKIMQVPAEQFTPRDDGKVERANPNDPDDVYYVPTIRDAADIERFFTYHPPKGNQSERYVKIREKAKELATVMAQCCPPSPELTKALGKLKDAVMEANSAIACRE